MEISSTLQKSQLMQGGPNAAQEAHRVQQTILVDQNQWASEVRKSDERCEQYVQMLQQIQLKLVEEQNYTKDLV